MFDAMNYYSATSATPRSLERVLPTIWVLTDRPSVRAEMEKAVPPPALRFINPEFFSRIMTENEPLADLLVIDSTHQHGLHWIQKLNGDSHIQRLPVVILGDQLDENARVQYYQQGVVDCIQRPVSERELSARVFCRVRQNLSPRLEIGNLAMDLQKLKVMIGGNTVEFTVLEFNLLRLFVENPEKVFGRAEILKKIWCDAHVMRRTVDAHIANVRKKMASSRWQIASIYGAGYSLRPLSQ